MIGLRPNPTQSVRAREEGERVAAAERDSPPRSEGEGPGWGACPMRGAVIPWPLGSVFRPAPRARYHRQPLLARQTDRS